MAPAADPVRKGEVGWTLAAWEQARNERNANARHLIGRDRPDN